MNKPMATRQLSYAVALLYNQGQTIVLDDVPNLTKMMIARFVQCCNDCELILCSDQLGTAQDIPS